MGGAGGAGGFPPRGEAMGAPIRVDQRIFLYIGP